jgi:FKBP-type peptidyl-prolyl cis-trans isomerase
VKHGCAFFLSLSLAAAAASAEALPDGLYAEIRTTRGTIVCTLAFDKVPMTVANFVGLAEGTINANRGPRRRYFDGLTFYRVVSDFVIQGGDPRGDGTGGPGYTFPNEIVPGLKHDGPGVLAMANAGPDTNGSQFYITRKALPSLDGAYSIFGRVVRGQNVVDTVRQGDKIVRVRILRAGNAAKGFTVTQEGFDAMVSKAKSALADRRAREREAVLVQVHTRWPKLSSTKSGLMYQVLKPGSGKSPHNGAEVTVQYVGKLLDGKVFDSSLARGRPAKLRIGEAIPGWNEALPLMKKGEKRLLIVPPALGYGERGYRSAIPPNSFLVYEVELLDF